MLHEHLKKSNELWDRVDELGGELYTNPIDVELASKLTTSMLESLDEAVETIQGIISGASEARKLPKL